MTTTLVIHAQPRASRTEVVGWHGDAIKIRLAAPPVDGAANAELIRFLVDRLHIPRSSVRLATGVAGRRKRVELEGIGRALALERLGVRSDQ